MPKKVPMHSFLIRTRTYFGALTTMERGNSMFGQLRIVGADTTAPMEAEAGVFGVIRKDLNWGWMQALGHP